MSWLPESKEQISSAPSTRYRQRRAPYKLLLVEGNREEAFQIKKTLFSSPETRCEVTHVEWLSDALREIAGSPYDAVLLNLFLPDSSGVQTLTTLRQATSSMPVVALARIDTVSAIEAIQAGAQEYVLKGRDTGKLLVRAVRYAIERKQVEEARAVHRQVHRRAFHLS